MEIELEKRIQSLRVLQREACESSKIVKIIREQSSAVRKCLRKYKRVRSKIRARETSELEKIVKESFFVVHQEWLDVQREKKTDIEKFMKKITDYKYGLDVLTILIERKLRTLNQKCKRLKKSLATISETREEENVGTDELMENRASDALLWLFGDIQTPD